MFIELLKKTTALVVASKHDYETKNSLALTKRENKIKVQSFSHAIYQMKNNFLVFLACYSISSVAHLFETYCCHSFWNTPMIIGGNTGGKVELLQVLDCSALGLNIYKKFWKL